MREVEVVEISEELSFLTLYFSKALRELDRICTKTLYNPIRGELEFIVDIDAENFSRLLRVLGIDTNSVGAVWAWSPTSLCLQYHERDVCPYISFLVREALVKISYCHDDMKYMIIEVLEKEVT